MRTSRRRLLLGGGGFAALAALGAGGAASLGLLRDPREFLVRRVIDRHVPGIVFDGEDLTRFTAEMNRMLLNRAMMGGRRAMAHYAGTVFLQDWPLARDLLARIRPTREIDREIVGAFFRATDFWDAPRVPGRRIRLLRSPDPYEARCANPLAVIA